MPSSETEKDAAIVLVSGVPYPLSYSIDPQAPPIEVGTEVIVDVGRRQASGFVVAKIPLAQAIEKISEKQSSAQDSNVENSQLQLFLNVERNLKPILSSSPAFLPDQLPLFQWMSEYYGVSLIEILDNVLPTRAQGRSLSYFRLTSTARTLPLVTLLESIGKRAKKQRTLIERLFESHRPLSLRELETECSTSRTALQSLIEKQIIEEFFPSLHELYALGQDSPNSNAPAYTMASGERILTASQQKAFEQIVSTIDSRSFSPILLFGVTGSGKTEVYLQAIEKVLKEGGSALVIVPEISLTPQLFDQFEARLKIPLALLHSQLGQAERWNMWEALLKGELKVAIGARSAIFAPLKDLRLIIVDEEHENSYKQSDGLRYHGRDVAVMRAKMANCPVLLGSATPSFESLLNATRNRYKLIEMPDRVTNRPLPQIEIVDLTKFKRSEMPSPNISPPLHQAMQETLEKKGQIIILYNRRGFASYLQCESCGESVVCPNCSVTLTYHRSKNRVMCHYCGLTLSPPTECKFCRDPRMTSLETDTAGLPTERKSIYSKVGKLVEKGGGTERVVEEIAALFPQATIIRMDRDTVGQKDAYRKILGDMRSRKADILVGTQMIAKGHDLPGVTLVGVVDADVGLHLPDFRSSEKAFQLITQAAGRAGRGSEPGRVIVQTHKPDHPTIVATATGRFKAFARYEIDFRQKLHYPPWGRLMRLVISSTNREEAFEQAPFVMEQLSKIVQECIDSGSSREADTEKNPEEKTPKVSILGPAPAPHEKLRARYRWHILVKSSSARLLSTVAMNLNRWKSDVTGWKDFRLTVDIDPVDML